MKLYTEEQVKIAIDKARDYYDGFVFTEEEVLEQLKPIELPSDEEIDSKADFLFPYAEKIGGETYSAFLGIKAGAKLMKEQLKNK